MIATQSCATMEYSVSTPCRRCQTSAHPHRHRKQSTAGAQRPPLLGQPTPKGHPTLALGVLRSVLGRALAHRATPHRTTTWFRQYPRPNRRARRSWRDGYWSRPILSRICLAFSRVVRNMVAKSLRPTLPTARSSRSITSTQPSMSAKPAKPAAK